MSGLESCKSLPVYNSTVNENKIRIPVSLFAENNLQIVRIQNILHDVAVKKESETSYTALLLRCTHADNALTVTGNGFYCNLHGSTFDNEGAVTKGPAEISLKKYKTLIDGDEILILID